MEEASFSRASSWATQQLAEFVAALSGFEDERSALVGAVERTSEAFEAEVSAIVSPRGIAASIGFAAGAVPDAALRAVAELGRRELDVPGVGTCAAIAVQITDAALGTLVVARHRGALSPEEVDLLRAMTRVLGATVRMLRLLDDERGMRERSERQSEENARVLDTLRERQMLLERLARIQRSIVTRTALDEVLDRIVTGASELLGDEVVTLRLIETDTPEQMVLVASAGVEPELRRSERRRRVGEGVAGQAVSEGRLVVIENYDTSPAADPAFASSGVRAAMAAPVRERGEIVGSLMVGTRRPGRSYSAAEREVLLTFAEHASLALTDARTVGDAIHQALHDPLTGLPNRALLLDRLRQALARATRSGANAAVLFCDLDTFKTVNDSLGHAAGDELLVGVARRLIAWVRPGDTAARFGGDEFVVLLEGIGDEDIEAAAQRILDAFNEPFAVGDREVSVTASIGIAMGSSESDELLRNADLALYRAKSKGKGHYELFAPEMHVAVVERLELEGDLRRGLEREEFYLDYQPIFKLRTGEIAGIEALARWRHPERGLLPPAEFIPVAEDSRLILPLGRWVLRDACLRAAAWRRRFLEHPALAMSVNLSSEQVREAELVEEVEGALAESQLDPHSLILELTETAFMEDVEEIAARLRELKVLGVQLAVDDFGTGYASLQHLRRFPIDVLKIAKSFVDELGGTSDDSALARAIIDLGGSFQLRVVAEGIEHPAQLDRLMELGCDLGQGFHFARPMEPEAIERLLGEDPRAAAGPALPGPEPL
ncbi:MAG TPA: EAL domain-containing protein [Solirubrobacterales bacterium]|nr:EAL domain-containing protein [Solirubrobacterales bacterium]